MSITGSDLNNLSKKINIFSNTKVALYKNIDFKKYVYWHEDLKETLAKVHRQANDHKASDFKDSELIVQDFINRWVDSSAASPMK